MKPAAGCCCLVTALAPLAMVCILILALAIPGVALLEPPMTREPAFPTDELIIKQLATLPQSWGMQGVTVETDRDLTWGHYMLRMIYASQDPSLTPYQRYNRTLFEGVHVFSHPFWARITKAPGPEMVLSIGPTPEGWTYIPPHADRFEIERDEETGWCQVALRYKEYIFSIEVHLSDEFTLDHLESLLQATDEVMADYLSNSILQRGTRPIPRIVWPKSHS